VRKRGVNSKTVNKEYMGLLESLGNEFGILMDLPAAEIGAAGFPDIADAVVKMRAGEINVSPGFDGEYGKIKIFGKSEKRQAKGREMPL
jgi:DNA helicase-2/ATP-dependent DNA helicase PcrA